MTEEEKLAKAQEVFATLCQTMDDNDWEYTKNEEKFSIDASAEGEDLPVDLRITVDSERELVYILSYLPFSVSEEKCLDAAIAVSAVNNIVVNGCFDYYMNTGDILFRITNSFADSIISKRVFEYMIWCACQTVDDYNDKLFMLSKGMISVDQFISMLEE